MLKSLLIVSAIIVFSGCASKPIKAKFTHFPYNILPTSSTTVFVSQKMRDYFNSYGDCLKKNNVPKTEMDSTRIRGTFLLTMSNDAINPRISNYKVHLRDHSEKYSQAFIDCGNVVVKAINEKYHQAISSASASKTEIEYELNFPLKLEYLKKPNGSYEVKATRLE